MTAFDFSGFTKALHPERSNGNPAAQVTQRLSSSNLGITKKSGLTTDARSAMDHFELTTNISELLSPACGMSDEEKQAYLAHIQAKLKAGKKLTAEEMRFLQAEYPDLYLQAARVQSMRESFEQQLKSCRSKEAVETAFSTSMSMVSDKDPMKEAITAAYQDAYNEFKESGDYQKLPDTEEEKEEKEKAED